MFNFFGKKSKILSPFSGECVPLEKVPDEAFSQKLLGEGVAIIPSDGRLVSPVDCVVDQIFDTLHAYVLKTSDNLEILIHIGINTVDLKGDGFDNKVSQGQKLKCGDLISLVDINYISEKGYQIYTPIVFTNSKDFNFDLKFGKVEAGVTEIVSYKAK